MRSEYSPAICSNRGTGFKPRTYFCAINSISHCGGDRLDPRLRGSDRALLVWMTLICPGLLNLAQVVKPETILRWHRASFKAYWRWKSRNRSRAVSPDQQSHGCDQSDSRLSIGARHPGPAGASLPTTNGKLSSAARV